MKLTEIKMEMEALHVPSSEPVMYFYESGCSAIAFGRGESNELKIKNFSGITFYKSPDVEGVVARVQKDGCGAAKLSQRDGRLMVRSQAGVSNIAAHLGIKHPGTFTLGCEKIMEIDGAEVMYRFWKAK